MADFTQNSRDYIDTLLSNPWYGRLVNTSAILHEETARFFASKGIGGLSVPTTTGSVSSPMGLGSDSLPVVAQIAENRVYLADSQQFLLELGLRLRPKGVYYISCSFRGEAVDPSHLSEFTHSETEISGGLDEIIALGSEYVGSLFRRVMLEGNDVFGSDDAQRGIVEAIDAKSGVFPSIRFDRAYAEYGKNHNFFREVCPKVYSITREGEKQLMRDMGGITWLTHLPRLACPFYQAPEPDTEACLSADLLFGIGEVLGSGERCRTADDVRRSLEAHGVSADAYSWYVAMKERAPVQSAGFGLGLERLLMGILGSTDIRQCTLWRREHGKVIAP